jgi:hypothetical protein
LLEFRIACNGFENKFLRMTHTHIRFPQPGPEQHRSYRLDIAAGAVIVVLIALYAMNQLWNVPQRTAYSYTYGKVIETQIVVADTRETLHGGLIFYRIETHVTFDLNDQHQDRWLPASDVTTAREMLAARLTPPPTSCRVYWLPEHPRDLKCHLE